MRSNRPVACAQFFETPSDRATRGTPSVSVCNCTQCCLLRDDQPSGREEVTNREGYDGIAPLAITAQTLSALGLPVPFSLAQ
jgi:hypothetical protein